MHDPKIPEKAASEAPWQLYAAAPEMLAALRQLAKAFEMAIRSNLSRDLYDSEEDYTAAVRSNVALVDAFKAIARAEGRS